MSKYYCLYNEMLPRQPQMHSQQLYNKNLSVLRFMGSYSFLKRPMDGAVNKKCYQCCHQSISILFIAYNNTHCSDVIMSAMTSQITGVHIVCLAIYSVADQRKLLRLNKRLSKQSWRRWFETASSSLWRHCNECAWFCMSFHVHQTK